MSRTATALAKLDSEAIVDEKNCNLLARDKARKVPTLKSFN